MCILWRSLQYTNIVCASGNSMYSLMLPVYIPVIYYRIIVYWSIEYGCIVGNTYCYLPLIDKPISLNRILYSIIFFKRSNAFQDWSISVNYLYKFFIKHVKMWFNYLVFFCFTRLNYIYLPQNNLNTGTC